MRPVAGSVQGTSGDNRGSTHGGAHKRSLAGPVTVSAATETIMTTMHMTAGSAVAAGR